ncbi:MAG: hypothetical protein CFE21_09860 [Bacteroidetes bacterium B1(2017)]|nr:MAG: hypothetical protein CFE21_09860 [Bacteroidetes bacterium B1(2017)]
MITNNFLLDKILLCEDDPVLRHNISNLLELEGYQVYQASNGLEAKQLLKVKRVVLILSDWSMPIMDGIELLKFAKSEPNLKHVPFIFLTAKTTIEDKLEALNLMADDFITKPFSLQELVLKCRNNIENRKLIIKSTLSQSDDKEYISRDQKFLTEIKAFIDLNLSNENLSLLDFGNEFPMSISSIQKNIKRVCGKSLFQLILEARLLKAKDMIEADTAPISEILFQCGFNNHNHFTKKFKLHFGVLPSKLNKK